LTGDISNHELWRPSAGFELLRARADLLAGIRGFFQQLGVMEVDTPVCSPHGVTDPAIESFRTSFLGPGSPSGRELYLHSSPEFPMKRLLAAGSGPIYQICKVFRNGELGSRHNPEFTLLEWYRPGFDHHKLMTEVAELINFLLPEPLAVQQLTYAQAFIEYLGFDPHHQTIESLRQCALDHRLNGADEMEHLTRDGWLDLLLSHLIEPRLGRAGMTFLYDYPASQAALARVRPGNPPLAERFELYLRGMEIANGFHELTDGEEQQRRFEDDNRRRLADGEPQVAMDRHLLEALKQGMPASAGVALGVDRLLMAISGKTHIEAVLAFPFERA
jgi:lysyl-tRNA synthetase class 2